MEYLLKRSHRKTLSIKITREAELVVSAPLKLSVKEIEKFIVSKEQWIAEKMASQKEKLKQRKVLHYLAGESHLFLGENYELVLKQGLKAKVEVLGDQMILYHRGAESSQNTRTVLESFYKKEAKSIFQKILDQRAIAWNLSPREIPLIRIKKMQTRWGSLSYLGYMNLNLSLIKSPYECIAYVIEHELCHLIHPNHSRDYYALLTSKMPDWKSRKNLLESMGI